MKMEVNLFEAYDRLEMVLHDVATYEHPTETSINACNWCSSAEKWVVTAPQMAPHLRKIITDVMDQVKRFIIRIYEYEYNPDRILTFEDLLKKQHTDPSETEKTNFSVSIGLQCTHTDADGYGSAMILQLFNSWIYETRTVAQEEDEDFINVFTPVVKCPEYISDQYIAMAMDVVYDMCGEQRPRYLFITDISMSAVTAQAISQHYDWVDNFNYQILSASGDKDMRNQAIYIDHHVTNPWFIGLNASKSMPKGIYACPTAGDLRKYKDIYLCLSEDCKISATLIAYSVLIGNVKRGLREHPYLPVRRTDRLINELYLLCRTISQWDTFEWRDHPQFNVSDNPEYGVTAEMIGNMEFEKPLVSIMNDLFEYLWSGRDFSSDKFPYFEINYGESMVQNDHYLKMAAEKLFAVSAVVKSSEINIGNSYGAPEKWVIVPFPTLGNFSLICHYMMNLEGYKKLQEDGTTGVIALDLMDSTVSFRCNEPVDRARVDKVAKVLGGGGHMQASGCHNVTFSNTLKVYLNKIGSDRKNYNRDIDTNA